MKRDGLLAQDAAFEKLVLVAANAFAGSPNPVSQLGGPGFVQIFTGHHMLGYNLTADLDLLTIRASVVSLKFRTYAENTLLQEGSCHFGVRLDWFKSVDFKAQIDHAKAFDYGTSFINARPSLNNQAFIFSLVADFVF